MQSDSDQQLEKVSIRQLLLLQAGLYLLFGLVCIAVGSFSGMMLIAFGTGQIIVCGMLLIACRYEIHRYRSGRRILMLLESSIALFGITLSAMSLTTMTSDGFSAAAGNFAYLSVPPFLVLTALMKRVS